jgi:hypothetical protein
MNIKCPGCGKEIGFENNPFRPFCSERCKLLDLGNWLVGSYGFPVEEDEDEGNPPELEDAGDS